MYSFISNFIYFIKFQIATTLNDFYLVEITKKVFRSPFKLTYELKNLNLIFYTSENFLNQLLSVSIEDIDFINHKKRTSILDN